LSLPVPARRSDGTSEVIGTVNLYGGPVDAFDGRREELVQWCTRWPPASALGTVSAAFDARRERFRRPEANRDQNAVDRAVAMLVERLGVDVTAAADRLSTAACHAGLAESQAAQLLNELLDPR